MAKGLVSTGLMIDYVSTGAPMITILPGPATVEAKVADWLTLRTGISKPIFIMH